MKKTVMLNLVLFISLLGMLVSCQGTTTTRNIAISVPRLQDFKADGSLTEWSKIGATRLYSNALGEYPQPGDLQASLRTAWNDEGLLVALDVTDNRTVIDTTAPWTADAIELFLSPFRGSSDILQLSFIARKGNDGQPVVRINDFRETPALLAIKPVIHSAFVQNGGHTTWEIVVNPLCLGIDPGLNNTMALQVYVDDADTKGSKKKNQVIWYNLGHSYLNSFAMYKVVFTENENTTLAGTSDVYITDDKKASMFIFGAVAGDKIQISRNGSRILETTSATKEVWRPDSLQFGDDVLDFDHDTLMVYINGKPVGFHDLYIAPRLYVNTVRKPFDVEIRNFVMKDRLSAPPSDGTLFIGSSSIRKWNTLKQDFPGLKIIHRGFGGSTSEEALMYMDKIVLPYKPATIVYYEGDNDVPRGYSEEKVRNNVKQFIDRVLEARPDTRIYILSPKPAIARMQLWDKYKTEHKTLKALASEYPNVTYVDVSTPMFDKDGKLRKEIFVNDGVHMNAQGYTIWTRVIRQAMGLKDRGK
ncbi:MAG TPA: GDSL-type esterase/lipase family protein [Bacteroidales bacterium]|nr:GDSL-type esterase/lipase family protein [Bacteroidales bacterium]